MQRLIATWKDFWASILWLDKVTENHDKIMKLFFCVVFVLGALGVSLPKIPATAESTSWMIPYVPWVVGLFGAYIIWQFAIAWDRNRGPIIWIDRIGHDDFYKFFEVRIENRGSGEVIANTYMTDLRLRNGRRVPRIDSQIKLHCRGVSDEERVILGGSRPATIAILKVAPGTKGAAHLLIPSPAPERFLFKVEPLTSPEPTPLIQQPSLIMSIRTEFLHPRSMDLLIDKISRFVIIPDEKSEMCYRIRPVRWFWE